MEHDLQTQYQKYLDTFFNNSEYGDIPIDYEVWVTRHLEQLRESIKSKREKCFG